MELERGTNILRILRVAWWGFECD